MPNVIPPGPYKYVATSDPAFQAPWYIVPFDKAGACTAPLTRRHLVDAVAQKTYTDVFLFSHGWNNDWDAASERYEGFIAGFLRMREEHGLDLSREYRPLLVGVFWPSIALVLPWEKPPRFAGVPGAPDASVEDWRREIEELGQEIADVAERDAFYELAQKDRLNDAEAKRLGEILARVAARLDGADSEVKASDEPVSAEELVKRAKALGGAGGAGSNTGSFGFAGGGAAPPQAAFSVSDLDPRNVVRIATVLQMKDRAARVGASGVGPLLREVLAAHPAVRVHLVGHSYGAIVVLSAMCYGADLPAKVDSVLLLQPAVSQWCFAENVAGRGFQGGYRIAFDRTRTPIFATFSRQDSPLTKLFHLAARRDQDLGQVQIASGGLPLPPSEFSALGGYGPAGLTTTELQVLKIAPPPTPLEVRAGARVCALNGNELIAGHGEVSVPATWWSLFQQVAA